VYYKIVPTTSTYISLFDFSQFVFYERRPSNIQQRSEGFLLGAVRKSRPARRTGMSKAQPRASKRQPLTRASEPPTLHWEIVVPASQSAVAGPSYFDAECAIAGTEERVNVRLSAPNGATEDQAYRALYAAGLSPFCVLPVVAPKVPR